MILRNKTTLMRGMLFDIGDTLLPASLIQSWALEKAARTLQEVGLIASVDAFVSVYLDIDKSTHGPTVNHLFSNREIVQKALAASGVVRPVEAGPRFLAAYRTLVRERIHASSELIGLFEAIVQTGHRIAAVTDGTTIEQVETLYRLGILRFFDSVITSEDIGREKPDPKLFRSAMSSIGAEPTNCLMVGDSMERDITGAQRLGIKSVLVVGYLSSGSGRRERGSADYVVQDVTDLLACLDPL